MNHSDTVDAALDRIFELLTSAASPESKIPPTDLYNEGWLLRLTLVAAERGAPCLPFQFFPRSKWFSEALLPSAFLGRHLGDELAEKRTQADGAGGHFRFSRGSKAGVELDPVGTQFVVLEAKVFSKLSKRTTNAPGFDQAARTVACMAELLRRSGRAVDHWKSLAFCVLAPASQIQTGVFKEKLDKGAIAARIADRISSYGGEFRAGLDDWNQVWVKPLLSSIEIHCLSWESVIARIRDHDALFGNGLQRFYEQTLRFNRSGRDRTAWRG